MCIRCNTWRTKRAPQPLVENGPEPEEGTWVVASLQFGCPDRLMWQHVGGDWVDEHGCRRPWAELSEPVVVEEVQP
jgi:hypothetical protein